MTKKILSSLLLFLIYANSVFAIEVGSRFVNNNVFYKIVEDKGLKGYVSVVDGVEDSYFGEINIPISIKYERSTTVSVRGLEAGCFYNCTNITAVTLSSSIKEIPDQAFYGCTNMHSVTINGNVESIGREAFYNCVNLQNINLPSTINTISDRAFCNCVNMEITNFPDNLTSIGKNAFGNCMKIKEFTISENMNSLDATSIPLYIKKLKVCNNAYSNMSYYVQNFTNCQMVIGANVTSITGRLTNEGITSLVFEDAGATSPLTVSGSCFYHCAWLKSVDFGKRDLVLNNYSFLGCSGLTTLDLTTPKSLVMNGNVFGGCSGLITTRINDPLVMSEASFSNCTGTLYITSANPKVQTNVIPFDNSNFTKVVFENAEEIVEGLLSYMHKLNYIEGPKVKKCAGIVNCPYIESISFDPSAFTFSDKTLWKNEEQGKRLHLACGNLIKLPADFCGVSSLCFGCKNILIDATDFSGELGNYDLWQEVLSGFYMRNSDVSIYATPEGCESLMSDKYVRNQLSRIMIAFSGNSSGLKGDMNGDGKVTVSDVNILVDELLK